MPRKTVFMICMSLSLAAGATWFGIYLASERVGVLGRCVGMLAYLALMASGLARNVDFPVPSQVGGWHGYYQEVVVGMVLRDKPMTWLWPLVFIVL